MKYRKYITILSAFGASPAMAQGEGAASVLALRPEEITVIATGLTQQISDSGQAISVVTRDEIAAVQGPDLARVLERLPGVSMSRTGPIGAQSGLFVRGANSDQVLVMIDGVRVADYASPGGGYDLGNLLAGSIDRIDLLRGSNSVIWGSQAIGGVLSVQTREIDGVEASAEYGAYDTAYFTGSAGLRGDRHAASLTAGYARTDGFSALSAGSEPDGFRQWQVSGKGRYALAADLTLRANGRYADSRLDIDQTGADAPDVQKSREGTGRLAFEYQRGGGLSLTGGYAYSAVRRHYETGFGPSTFRGSGHRVDAKGRFDLVHLLSLDFGADSEWSRASSSFDPRARARLSSAHALIGWRGAPVRFAAGVRLDDHSRFGSHWTVGGNGSVALGRQWRLRAAYGEGFKAPTLYQLFGGFVGNPALKPERSRAWEVGIERGDRNARLHLAATLFRRDSRNLIDLDSAFVYANTARARAEGIEVELGAQVSPRFRAAAAYTYLKARDRTLGRDLARRPRHAVSAHIDWRTPLDGLELGADLRFASDSVDYDFLGTRLPIASHAVGTVRAGLAVAEGVTLFGRIENLGDVRYETVAGYATAGRSAYLGARARF